MKRKSRMLSSDVWLITAIVLGVAISLLVTTQAKEAPFMEKRPLFINKVSPEKDFSSIR